jgi:DNA repair exonuclease SbcCD nuclease subunit
MLDVLERAGLFTNIANKAEVVDDKLKLNFTIDKKTGAKITGMIGKKGGLEKEYYKRLEKESLEKELGYKIFMFHSALTEFKSKELSEMYSQPLSFFPKGFDYYAGGHVHEILFTQDKDYGWITYPGPLFPANFKELEKLERGGFFLVEVEDGTTKVEFQPLQIYNIFKIIIDAENKTPEEVETEIYSKIKGKEFNNTIVTIRVSGILKSGKPSDIKFKEIFNKLHDKSAYFVMKNTSALHTKEFENIKISTETAPDIEDSIVKEHLQQIKIEGLDKEKEFLLVKELITFLNSEKDEGEKVMDFQQRIKQDGFKTLDL